MGIYQINTLSLGKMTNTLHISFHNAVYAQVETQGLATLGISAAQGKAYRDAIKAEQDMVRRTTASENTSKMQAADEKRDQVFLRILTKLKVAQYADAGTDLANAWDVINRKLVSQYPASIIYRAQHEESALLQGFIVDVKAFLSVELRTALGIGSDINALDDANAEFQAAYLERSAELGTADTPATRTLRAVCDEVYHKICIYVNFEANNEAEDHAETAAACTTFVGTVNQVIKEYKARLKSLYGGTPAEDEGGEGEKE